MTSRDRHAVIFIDRVEHHLLGRFDAMYHVSETVLTFVNDSVGTSKLYIGICLDVDSRTMSDDRDVDLT